MRKSLKRKQEVKLKSAEKNSDMKGYKLETIDLQIDKKSYSWTIYESEIQEDFIIGLDFLLYHKAKLYLESNAVSINRSVVPAILRREKNELSYQVSRINCAKRSVIPPYTAKVIKCEMKNPIIGEFPCEVDKKFEGVIDEATLHNTKDEIVTLVYRNNSNKYVTLKKNEAGVAMEIEDKLDLQKVTEGKCESKAEGDEYRYNVRNISTDQDNSNISDQLKELFQKSTTNLKDNFKSY